MARAARPWRPLATRSASGIPGRLGGWLVRRTGWLRDGVGSRGVGVRGPAVVPGAGRGGCRGAGDDPASGPVPRAPGSRCRADAADAASVRAALEGCEAAYYLVHSLASADFRDEGRGGGARLRPGRGRGRVTRIVYLGGLGADGDMLSAHLRSRRQVEALLGEAGVPVTTLRAGIIVGHGGISWEITRQLVEHLPAMITPRWVRTRTQPIAAADVIRYLVGGLAGAGGGRAGVRDRRPGGARLRRHVAPGRRAGRPQDARSCRCRCSPRRCRRCGWRW